MWKLWKKVLGLHKFQALAGHNVQPVLYQYKDLKLATRDFHKDNCLGRERFTTTYKGEFEDGTVLAVRKRVHHSPNLKGLDDLLNEVVLITGIKHRNLVQLKGCCIETKQPILVYEYVENGDLSEALLDQPWGPKPHRVLNWGIRFNICVGVARGLSYLHEGLEPFIIHRDIKPSNILLDMNLNPKICQFGLARSFSHESSEDIHTRIEGTYGYLPPEYMSTGQISTKVDVYSYGVVVLNVISGRKSIDSSLSDEDPCLVPWVRKKQNLGLLLEILQPELRENCVLAEVVRAINVGLLCVQDDPTRRPSMSQVVNMLLGCMDIGQQHQTDQSDLEGLLTDRKIQHPDDRADDLHDLYNDPITEETMCDPVSCSDGRTYCRWTLIDNGMTRSPYDRTPLTIYCDDITTRSRLFRVFPEQSSKFRERRNKHRDEALQHARTDPVDFECAIEMLNDVLSWDRGDDECRNELARTLSLVCQTFLQPSVLDTIPEVMHEDVIRARLENEGALFLTFLLFFYIAIWIFII